jgi:glycosyltransferase involved in cell wall biosynthesis
MNNPVFSIITPTNKRPELLKRAVRSVLEQSFESFELIIVDDANDPDVSLVVQQSGDSRVRLISHARNMGAAAAYNTGIRASTGPFISFLGDDDEYYPLFLEKTNDFFETAYPDIGFIWTGVKIITDAGEGEVSSYDRLWPSVIAPQEDAYIEATTIGNGFGMTMRRECLSITGLYNESFRVCVDTDLLFKLAQRFSFATIPEVLVKIYQHRAPQLTGMSNSGLRLETHEKILNENIDFVCRYPRLFRMHFEHLVRLSYSLKRKQKGRQLTMKLIKREPCRALQLMADLVCYEMANENSKTIQERLLRFVKKTIRRGC